MYARVTLFEIDTLRMNLDEALEKFKESIVPEARKQQGYEGMYVMRTSEGKGLVLSFWANEEAAVASQSSGYYDEQLAQFVALFRAPAGREGYEVVFAETPGATR
ncbi:MAG: antibiotic biosynthesis monooxygenase [Dehalococcoidia bacterium]